MIKIIEHNNVVLAIIINEHKKEGISFFTPDDFSQQLAYMQHEKGKKIEPHIHNLIKREVHYTQEVLFIRKGKLRSDFYDSEKVYIGSYVLKKGDVILLANGGHGFEVLEDVEMFEVKQGPYAGVCDKTRFKGINSSKINMIGRSGL